MQLSHFKSRLKMCIAILTKKEVLLFATNDESKNDVNAYYVNLNFKGINRICCKMHKISVEKIEVEKFELAVDKFMNPILNVNEPV